MVARLPVRSASERCGKGEAMLNNIADWGIKVYVGIAVAVVGANVSAILMAVFREELGRAIDIVLS